MADFIANRVHVEGLSAGAGPITLGGAISSAYQSFSTAGVPNGATIPYTAYTTTQFECSRGLYDSGTPSLGRIAANVDAGSAGVGSLVNFTTNPRVFIGPLAKLLTLVMGDGSTISWANEDVVLTHVTGQMRWTGGSYRFDGGGPSSGGVIIGMGVSSPTFQFTTPQLTVASSNAVSWGSRFHQYGNDESGVLFAFSKTRGDGPGDNVTLQDGDSVVFVPGYGNDGTVFPRIMGAMELRVDGAPGVNDMPGAWIWRTRPKGGTQALERFRIDNAGRQSFGSDGAQTIAGGAITAPAGVVIRVDTEGAAATDDLDSIGTVGVTLNTIVYLRAANSARTVVVKDSTGNIRMNTDFSLDHSDDVLALLYVGDGWIEISRSDNAP